MGGYSEFVGIRPGPQIGLSSLPDPDNRPEEMWRQCGTRLRHITVTAMVGLS